MRNRSRFLSCVSRRKPKGLSGRSPYGKSRGPRPAEQTVAGRRTSTAHKALSEARLDRRRHSPNISRRVTWEKLPADVGGRGSYEVAATVLGTSHTYLERFSRQYRSRRRALRSPGRGRSVLRPRRRLVRQATGRCAGATSRAPVLASRVSRRPRNLSAIAWLAAAQSGTAPKPDDEAGTDVQVLPAVVVRVLDYLVEHDYLAAHETRSIASELQDDDDRWHWLRRMLARKSGLEPGAAEGALAFLRNRKGFTTHGMSIYGPRRIRANSKTSAESSFTGEQERRTEPTVVLEQLLEPTISDFTTAIDWVHHDELRLTLGVCPSPARDQRNVGRIGPCPYGGRATA